MTEVAESVTLGGGVLVGHDGSAAAGEAVRWAAGLAAQLGKPLHVLRAWGLTNAPTPRTKEDGYVPPLADYEEAVREELVADLDELDLECDVRPHVVHGRPSRTLLAAAESADMLVVGKRGEGGFRGLGFGSTADQVVQHAPCPVIAVPVHSPDE